METASQILQDLLDFIQTSIKKKREDLLNDWDKRQDFENRMRKYLKKQPKYSEDLAPELIERAYRELHDLESKYYFWNRTWKFIIKVNKNPLPTELGMMLAQGFESPIADALVNSHQDIEVYFEAADNSKYARSRLCIRLFIEEQYFVDDLQRYLDKYGKQGALRVLENRTPSSSEKYSLFTESEIKDIQGKWYEGWEPDEIKKIRRNFKRGTIIREREEEKKRIHKDREQ